MGREAGGGHWGGGLTYGVEEDMVTMGESEWQGGGGGVGGGGRDRELLWLVRDCWPFRR